MNLIFFDDRINPVRVIENRATQHSKTRSPVMGVGPPPNLPHSSIGVFSSKKPGKSFWGGVGGHPHDLGNLLDNWKIAGITWIMENKQNNWRTE